MISEWVPPYSGVGATMCAPARRNVIRTALTAAIPEANACPATSSGAAAPSREATAEAKVAVVGLSIRPYA